MKRAFTDDLSTLRYEISDGNIWLYSGRRLIVNCKAPENRAILDSWSALATACEASETLRPYARRIRHMLGTAAGIDTP